MAFIDYQQPKLTRLDARLMAAYRAVQARPRYWERRLHRHWKPLGQRNVDTANITWSIALFMTFMTTELSLWDLPGVSYQRARRAVHRALVAVARLQEGDEARMPGQTPRSPSATPRPFAD